MRFQKINYDQLNARQKENYNFHKVASLLAEYGYHSIRLTDDYQGADFLAVHVSNNEILRIQLKGRLTFSKKYVGKDLYVCFRWGDDWFLYPHDELLETVSSQLSLKETNSWQDAGLYSFPKLSSSLFLTLSDYKIASESPMY